MTDTKWTLHGREFANCNCSYGCPCQFNALPTHGNCWAVVDIDKRRSHLRVPGYIEQRGEPIVNPISGAEHRISISPVGGFEFKTAEIGRGWTKTSGPVSYELTDSYGQFCELHLCQDGIIN